jgi:energy-coupling factor transporter ATP-binding protein EcfA2
VSVSDEILSFSGTLVPWQQDALRRVVTGTALDDAAVSELTDMALGVDGAPEPMALAEDDFDLAHAHGEQVVLSKLHSTKHVNALAEGQEIAFAQNGLTIIYGENGSGKSGYSRILRRVCRARKAPGILPDVRGGAAGPAKASFDLVVTPLGGGEDEAQAVTEAWVEGGKRPDRLARFMVFDRICEQDIIDGEAEAEFAPLGLSAFKELSDLLERVKATIQQRATQVAHVDLSALGPSVVGCEDAVTLLDEIKDRINTPTAKRLHMGLEKLRLSSEEDEQVVQLEQQLKEADPTKKAASLRQLAEAIGRKITELTMTNEALGEPKVEELRSAYRAMTAAADAARVVEQRANLTPLAATAPDIGGEIWKKLYEAAEAYATASLHPEQAFSDPEVQERCPLCLQDLDEAAQERFQRFHAFMDQKTRAQAVQTKSAYEQMVEVIRGVAFAEDQNLTERLKEAGQDGLADALAASVAGVIARREAIISGAEAGAWVELPPIPEGAAEALKTSKAALLIEAQQLVDAADVDKRKEKEATVASLKARSALLQSEQVVKDAISASEKRYLIFSTGETIKTRGITNKGKSVAEELLKAGLKTKLNAEMAALGVGARLSVDLGHRGRSGRNLFKIQMDGVEGHACSEVWSEGEQRVVALGFFLAEAVMAPDPVGLILDDPVSSLDHRWAKRIADRLAVVAQERQVIVFTHSIAFHNALERACAKRRTPMHAQYIARRGARSGYCEQDAEPWEKLRHNQRIKGLHKSLEELRPRFDEQNPEALEYARPMAELCSRLRAAWERSVEELVLNSVVERFGYAVKVQSLKGVACDDQVHKRVNDAVGLLSEVTEAHDDAEESYPRIFTPDELAAMIDDFKSFADDQNKAKGSAEADGRALDVPPAAVVS